MADRIVIAYGPPGSGKTEAAIAMAKAIYAATGKKTRVYVGDGSLANWLDSGLIEAGIVEVFDYANAPWPLTTTQQMTEGWWPDAQGKLKPPTPADLAQLGLTVYEALSTMIRDYLMGNVKGGFAEQSSRGIKIGQDSPYRIMDAEVKAFTTDKYGNSTPIYDESTGTGQWFGGNPISHFNVAQTHANGLIRRTHGLPGWVWWNSHEKIGEEKKIEGKGDAARTVALGDIVIGPEVAGGAATAALPRLFNDCLHFTTAQKVTQAQDGVTQRSVKQETKEYRVYFRDHYDPDGLVQIPYRGVVRCSKPELLPETGYLTGRPGEAVTKLYELVARAKRDLAAEALALKAKREATVAAQAQKEQASAA